jgi:hypothetical protein
MTLEWTRIHPDARGSRTKCGGYSVCSIGTGSDEQWEAWKLAPGGPWFAPLKLGLPDEAAARAIAQADADAKAGG